MQKWEYLSAVLNNDYVNDKICLSISEVNGSDSSFLDENGVKCYLELHEFLEQKGHEGWEVIGVTPLNISTTGLVKNSLILLRRIL